MGVNPLEPKSNTQAPIDANNNGLAVLPDVGESGILDTQWHDSVTREALPPDSPLTGKEREYLNRLQRRAAWLARRSGAHGHNPHGDRDIAELHAIEWAIELIEQVYGLPRSPYLSARGKGLKEFFNTAMRVSFDGCEWGGADIQDKAVELGLARIEPFDPDKHGEHNLDTVEPGEEWLVITC